MKIETLQIGNIINERIGLCSVELQILNSRLSAIIFEKDNEDEYYTLIRKENIRHINELINIETGRYNLLLQELSDLTDN